MQRNIKATRRDLLKAMAAWTAAATLAGCSNNSWLRQLAQAGFSGNAAQSRSDLRPWVRYPEKVAEEAVKRSFQKRGTIREHQEISLLLQFA
jgi:hypothetical protein